VKRWRMENRHGTIVAGGHGVGARYNQLKFPTYVLVDRDHSVYVSDTFNHRVMKWKNEAKSGTSVASYDLGTSLGSLMEPRGVVVDQLGTVYVADCSNSRIIRWLKNATEGNVIIGGNGNGARPNQLSCPEGLAFDRYGNLYVADSRNNRVQRFDIKRSS
jgi:DNA-binding beta-propeller fold protein YncE